VRIVGLTAHLILGPGRHIRGELGSRAYYGFPEHRSDPSIGQSHILAGKRDGVTRELEKWSALIGSDTFCPIEGSDRCSGNP